MYRLGNFGEEQVAGFKTSGDLFSEAWIFGMTTSTMYYYEALENSEILTIERDELLKLLDKQPHLKDRLFTNLLKNYTGLMLQVSALEQSRATEKLLLTLNYMLYRYGKECRPGHYSINMQLTHSTFASMMGLARETAAAELIKLKRRGVISYDRKHFIINKERLMQRIGDESLSEFFSPPTNDLS
jgi:CRP-like cAMP-binding protein